jgi:hypothetical protein
MNSTESRENPERAKRGRTEVRVYGNVLILNRMLIISLVSMSIGEFKRNVALLLKELEEVLKEKKRCVYSITSYRFP